MKRTIYILMLLILGINSIQAKPVTPNMAKNLAISFYKQHSDKIPGTVTLAYTEKSATGEAVYYVFNINTNDGFVIVAAEDAARPVLGYSTEKQYVIPLEHTAIAHWMKKRSKEILSIRAANIQATQEIIQEWKGNFSLNQANKLSGNANTASTMSVAPLVKSTLNQSPYYNASCPGTGSNQAITGCVATAMAQIMRYWSYPAKGTGSSSYCDCTSSGFTTQYGTLSANYGATTYSWSAMPLADASVTSSSCGPIATLMSHCGISVQMNYSPDDSGSWMITGDDATACAQISYVKYFGYNSATIQGLYKSNYSDAAWTTLLQNEHNNGRPVQYVGDDASQGGHSWVCDGYDASNNFHMNWGWAGYDNGYFPLTNLTTDGGFNPIENQEALIGIQPPSSVDAGISAISEPSGMICALSFTPAVTLYNYGVNTLTGCTINYKIDAGTAQTYSWSGSLATGQTANITLPAMTVTAGTHTFTSATTKPNNTTDANTSNDQNLTTFITGTTGSTLPLSQGFESSASLPAGWVLKNPDADAAWQVVTTVAHTGTNCIGFNNYDGDGSTDLTGKKDWFYTATYNFSSASTATLSFDVAYAAYTYSGTVYGDTLAVQYSTDCGATWTQVYIKGGTTLASAPTDTSTMTGFSPTSSQWRTDKITLPSAVLGKPSVMFAFENISDWGEWLYIDNINITVTNSTTGISSNVNNDEITLYPNPAHTNLFVNISENTNALSVTNIIGQTVIPEQQVDGSKQTESIDISNLSDGIYFIKVSSTNSQTKIIRFIKN